MSKKNQRKKLVQKTSRSTKAIAKPIKRAVKKPAKKKALAYFYLLLNTLCWGAALVVVKPVYQVSTAFRFLLYRYFIAGLVATPFVFYYYRKFWQKKSKKLRNDLARKIVVLELIGVTLALSLLYTGLKQTQAIDASLLSSTTTIFTVIAGVIFLKEKEERHELIGLIIAFGGTILLTVLPALNHPIFKHSSLLANLLILACNLFTATYFILAKKYYQGLPKLFVAGLSFYIGLLSFFLLSWLELNANLPLLLNTIGKEFFNPVVLFPSLYMGVLGSVVALTAYIKGQEYIEASEASLFWYLQPLIYLPLGAILLKEQISIWQIGILFMIVFGFYIANRRKKHP